jgi:DNA-binding NtrC family response regulator
VRFSPPANQALLLYDWSGNVRQLRNAIQRACLLCRGDVILAEHLPATIARSADETRPSADVAAGSLAQMERATILAVLDECGGNRTQAAKKLGISRRTLIYKLREFGAGE